MPVCRQDLFSLPLSDSYLSKVVGVFRKPIENLLGISTLNRMYSEMCITRNVCSFTQDILNIFDVSISISDPDLKKIPSSGRAVIVANHPFGALEGIILSNILLKIRSDAKIMANHLLRHIPNLRDMFFFVDPYAGKDSASRNLTAIRESLLFLKNEGLLSIFPSGSVSGFDIRSGCVTDSKWNPMIAGIIRKTRSPVIPIYFKGANGLLFQLAGLAHPLLRTILLPRELINKSGYRVEMKVGSSIPPDKFDEFKSDDDLISYLRIRTYNLKHACDSARSRNFFRVSWPFERKTKMIPVISRVESEKLKTEVENLPLSALLHSSGDLEVYAAEAEELPLVLREIGRLREITFRLAGEGTGLAADIDPFDDYYRHIFIWNRIAREIVGAYRLGLTDEIRARFGKKGMYTCTLFKYKKAFLESIHPAIELGRSFVTPEYQKHYQSLYLLWKGVALFLSANRKYRYLFGPVSISNDYNQASKRFMIDFLKNRNMDELLIGMVKPKNPPRFEQIKEFDHTDYIDVIGDISDVECIIKDIEGTPRGIPVLLRHYLKLGGKLLAFNVDRKFSNVVDGLILVDAAKTPIHLLSRYMGAEKAAEYLSFHRGCIK